MVLLLTIINNGKTSSFSTSVDAEETIWTKKYRMMWKYRNKFISSRFRSTIRVAVYIYEATWQTLSMKILSFLSIENEIKLGKGIHLLLNLSVKFTLIHMHMQRLQSD